MRTLSSTLLAAQKQATRTPYLKVEVRQRIGAATRLDFQRIYDGSEEDYRHAATCPGDGSLIRARLQSDDPNPAELYRQRVTNPGQGSDLSQWTYIADVGYTGGTAFASYGVNVIHFWVDTDYKTIKYQESSNYGDTWGSVQTLIISSDAVYHLAAAMKPNGDVCLCYFEWDVIKAVKRESGVWGSPQTWTNDLNQFSGIAIAYHNDWNLVISGRDTSDRRGVWTCIYGDGGEVTLETWSALKEILLAEIDSNTDYKYPSLTYDGNSHRLTLQEVFAADETYSRPYLSFQVPGSPFLDNLWREPYPFDLQCDYGLAIVSVGSPDPTSKAFLTTPYGVWQATLNPTPLDLTADVLDLKQEIRGSPGASAPGRLIAELRNDKGQYASFDKKGCELLVSPGYHTTAGDECSPGPSFWIGGYEWVSAPSYSRLIIYATDAGGLLESWRARRQLTWAINTSTVKEILIYILSRIGIPLSVQSQSTLIATFKPAFTIHPGESGFTALKRLLSMVPDVPFFREATAYLKHPQISDSTDYSYFLVHPEGSLEHPLQEGRYSEEAMNTNRVQVWGTQTPHVMVDRFAWDDLEDVYDRLHQVHDLNIDTLSLAEQRADALLREAEIQATDGEISVPMNCGQELWDVIEITDARVNFQSQKYRVRALGILHSISKPEYRLKVVLGAL
jgi:hypothetical protein